MFEKRKEMMRFPELEAICVTELGAFYCVTELGTTSQLTESEGVLLPAQKQGQFGCPKNRAVFSNLSCVRTHFVFAMFACSSKLFALGINGVRFYYGKRFPDHTLKWAFLSLADLRRLVQVFHRHGDRTPLQNYYKGTPQEKEEREMWKELVGVRVFASR